MKRNSIIALILTLAFAPIFAGQTDNMQVIEGAFPVKKYDKSQCEIIYIWDGVKMAGKITEPSKLAKKKNLPCVSVKKPSIELYLLKSDKPMPIVLICPGGAYNWLSINHEGKRIVDFFKSYNISSAILRYRVPNNMDGALMDAQRAIRILRANAKKWNLDPDKICIMGFSAGASLSARTSTNFATNSYEPLDDTDKLSSRPNLTCLIYPAYCSQPEKDRRIKNTKLAKEGVDYNTRYKIADWNIVSKETPPAFITQTQFDPYVDASLAYYLALKDAGVPAELHMLPKGAHGHQNPKVFEMLIHWLKSHKF